jgi:F0F1-type ATP synthase membrane subunit b/b'
MFFGFEILVGLFAGVLLATIVVLVMHMRTTSQVSKLTFPAYEYAMKKAEHDAEELLSDARKKARTIIADSEKAGHATIEGYTNQATDIHAKYKQVISAQTSSIEKRLHAKSDEQVHALQKILGAAEDVIAMEQKKITDTVLETNKRLHKSAEETEKKVLDSVVGLQTHVAHVGEELGKQLDSISANGAQKITEHLDALQVTADGHIEQYEQSRKKLMDAHIEQLVESVVVKVLHTKLPVAEHASLARKALEEAKAKHIL